MMAYAYLVEKNTVFAGSKITPVRSYADLVGLTMIKDPTITNAHCIFMDQCSNRTEHKPSLSSLQ